MCPDISPDRRIIQSRKTFPKDGRIPKKTHGRIADKIPFGKHKKMRRNAGYRSGFELKLAQTLIQNKINFTYEDTRISYVPKVRTYTPDFYLVDSNIYIEAKGNLTKDDRVKMVLVKQQNPEYDIRIVFMNARNKIYKGSKTTYGDWADRYGFMWAEGSIPKEWLK
jgi:hypothetical protein|tara:strand:- start:245 stop:742 length:498 start_codon:yes stop_codon:yes gene_type:complete